MSLPAGQSFTCAYVPLADGQTYVVKRLAFDTSPTDTGGLSVTLEGHYNAGGYLPIAVGAREVSEPGAHFATTAADFIIKPSEAPVPPVGDVIEMILCAERTDSVPAVSVDITVTGYILAGN